MESFFSRYKNALVLMLVVLAQVVLLAMQVRRPAPGLPEGHNIRLWRYLVSSVVTPPERLAHNFGLGLRGVWSNYLYLRHLREQNLSLQDENDRLRLEQAGLAEDARAGERLRALLDFRGRYIDQTLPAQVIGTSGTDQARVIYIDKGSKDGLRAQMPVITPDGIIGKVKNVFPGSAQVVLISDQTSGTGVMLETTRIRGVMKGNASGEPQMINISPDERIQPGDQVVTSGGDQVYPPGIPVGVVERVAADPDTSYVNVVIRPDANLAKLEEVMVVTAVSDKMPFGQEKDMMQSEVDALAEKQRAADILAEKLPSLREAKIDETAAASDDSEATASAGGGDPARPMRPPQAIHPDRYTPGAAPVAESLTPGAAPPIAHREPSTAASAAAAPRTPKPGEGAAGEASAATGRNAVPLNRFPPKPVAAVSSVSAAVSNMSAAGSGVASGRSGAPPVNTAASGPSAPEPAVSNPAGSNASGSVTAAPRVAERTTAAGGGSILVLPLQPADSGAAARRAAAAASAGASAETSSIPRATASSGVPAASSAYANPLSKPASRPVSEAGAAGEGSSSARSSSATGEPPAGSPTRRVAISADSDAGGILTPAGMGSIVAPPRPRSTTPAGAAADGNTAAHPATAAKPASPRPQNSGAQTPGAQTGPAAKTQSAPSKQPAGTPPGGG